MAREFCDNAHGDARCNRPKNHGGRKHTDGNKIWSDGTKEGNDEILFGAKSDLDDVINDGKVGAAERRAR